MGSVLYALIGRRGLAGRRLRPIRPFLGELRKITVTEKDKKGPEDEEKNIA